MFTLAVTGQTQEGGSDSPRILTDEQIDICHENLEGIAMYVAVRRSRLGLNLKLQSAYVSGQVLRLLHGTGRAR
ncbi:hypothetical protein DIE15_23465 [Burkholderia sp. Bp9031]|nr:hypothetical protein [Burkholderia ambifaria]RQZ12375.1 hypothetical protein DIE15_23465 [Burkholderia sp. Bp9031]